MVEAIRGTFKFRTYSFRDNDLRDNCYCYKSSELRFLYADNENNEKSPHTNI